MRSGSTSAEERLWYYLRNRRFSGVKFRRQHPFGPYILDFYAPRHNLAIEVDGPNHFTESQAEKDGSRTQFLEINGIMVLRFSNTDIYESIESVLTQIYAHLDL